MTTRDIQREETKKRIYDVAFKLFDEFGYDKVKVSDIAKAANVSVGSVYYHYKNKEAIIDYGYYEFDQMLKEAYEKQTFNSEREAILFLIDFQIKDVFLDIGLKMTTICFKNQINAENAYLYCDERYLYQKLLENLNNIQHMNKEHAAKMMLRISRGSIYDWCCHNGSYDLIEAVHEEISIVLDYIGLQKDESLSIFLFICEKIIKLLTSNLLRVTMYI